MFSNLVQIELIRLFKSRILKITALTGLVVWAFWCVVIEFLISLDVTSSFTVSVEGNMPVGAFRLITYIMAFSFVLSVITPLTVIITTCGYYSHRLAVNIEGAVRNRLKLCLAELTGIGIFILALYLLVIPIILALLPGVPADVIHDFFSGDFQIAHVILLGYLGNFGSCAVVYLISKVFVKALQSLAMSILVGFLSFFMLTVGIGLIGIYSNSAGVLADPIEYLAIVLFVVLPVVLLIIGTVAKFKKEDRI